MLQTFQFIISYKKDNSINNERGKDDILTSFESCLLSSLMPSWLFTVITQDSLI